MAKARHVLGLACVALAVSVPVVARASSVSASCGTGAFPTVTASGVVVSTSIVPDSGVFVAMKADDGSSTTVLFAGRNPNNTLPDGSENTVEDAWTGDLPQVGGRYTITGAEFEGSAGPLSVSNCAASASVVVLASPPTSAATATVSQIETDARDSSAGVVIAVIVTAALGIGALVLVLRRRSAAVRQ